ncbi:neurotrophin 1-like [Penaeus monodon]|uniref:neurotrophin 1-like n=1 Tax=Penaeus monodon TaxID=6687 RepID=UPI0018A6E824|nr:neurotrophin 1-like [Penaeus monodon]
MVSKDQEEAFDYSYYTGASTGDSPYDATHWGGPEGYICPSEVVYAMPKRAQNADGKWRVIVNDVHYYSQTARLETCLFPESACRALAPCYQSHCTQKSVYHRLLSCDPCDPYKGLFIDIYKMPSACSCHLPA